LVVSVTASGALRP